MTTRDRTHNFRGGAVRSPIAVTLMCMALTAHPLIFAAQGPAQRTFATPEDAVRGLIEAVKAGNPDEMRAIFGPEAQELIASSDVGYPNRLLCSAGAKSTGDRAARGSREA